jgi:hypothetical protein
LHIGGWKQEEGEKSGKRTMQLHGGIDPQHLLTMRATVTDPWAPALLGFHGFQAVAVRGCDS